MLADLEDRSSGDRKRAIREALRAFRDQTKWQVLMRNGMMKDFSWNASAREYGKVYDRVRQMRAAATLPEKVLI